MATEQEKDNQIKGEIVVMLRDLKKMENRLIDHYTAVKDRNVVQGKTLDDMFGAVSKAVTHGERFLIG